MAPNGKGTPPSTLSSFVMARRASSKVTAASLHARKRIDPKSLSLAARYHPRVRPNRHSR